MIHYLLSVFPFYFFPFHFYFLLFLYSIDEIAGEPGNADDKYRVQSDGLISESDREIYHHKSNGADRNVDPKLPVDAVGIEIRRIHKHDCSRCDQSYHNGTKPCENSFYSTAFTMPAYEMGTIQNQNEAGHHHSKGGKARAKQSPSNAGKSRINAPRGDEADICG